MTRVHLAAVGLTFALGLGAARAAEPERTGSLGTSRPVALGRPEAVTLPEQSVTAPPPPVRAPPPLKPLPKWDPHVCIGC